LICCTFVRVISKTEATHAGVLGVLKHTPHTVALTFGGKILNMQPDSQNKYTITVSRHRQTELVYGKYTMFTWILQYFKHNNPASRRIEFCRHRKSACGHL